MTVSCVCERESVIMERPRFDASRTPSDVTSQLGFPFSLNPQAPFIFFLFQKQSKRLKFYFIFFSAYIPSPPFFRRDDWLDHVWYVHTVHL